MQRALDPCSGSSSSSSQTSGPHHLPVDLRLRILALLSPHDLTLAGCLVCRHAALRFSSRPHNRSARHSQPLPGHAATTVWCVEGARVAMRRLRSCQQLLLLSTAAARGCKVNVEFGWQMLRLHVFPGLLHTEHYHTALMRRVHDDGKAAVLYVESAAVRRVWRTRCPPLPGAALPRPAGPRAHPAEGMAAACAALRPGRAAGGMGGGGAAAAGQSAAGRGAAGALPAGGRAEVVAAHDGRGGWLRHSQCNSQDGLGAVGGKQPRVRPRARIGAVRFSCGLE